MGEKTETGDMTVHRLDSDPSCQPTFSYLLGLLTNFCSLGCLVFLHSIPPMLPLRRSS
jgi:hypothetical protein